MVPPNVYHFFHGKDFWLLHCLLVFILPSPFPFGRQRRGAVSISLASLSRLLQKCTPNLHHHNVTQEIPLLRCSKCVESRASLRPPPPLLHHNPIAWDSTGRDHTNHRLSRAPRGSPGPGDATGECGRGGGSRRGGGGRAGLATRLHKRQTRIGC